VRTSLNTDGLRCTRSGMGLVFFMTCSTVTLAIAGCQDETLISLPQPTDQIDVFTQKAAAEVDILWVVDNSGSMGAEQKKVADRFGTFFQQLLVSQVDYRVGVITTDPAERGVLRASRVDVEGCAGCRFLSRAVACPNPAVAIDDLAGNEDAIRQRLSSQCPAQLVFRDLITVGTDGSAFEAGFAAAARALGADTLDPITRQPTLQPPAENAGFLRDRASLYIVFVSDEEEGDKREGAPVVYYQRLLESLKGPGNEGKVTVAGITGWPLDAETPLSQACDVYKTGLDADASNDDPRLPGLHATLHDFENGCVDTSASNEDRDLAIAETGGRYVELACRTRGVVANLCEADYATALDALGASAAGLSRKFTVSLPERLQNGSDCVLFGAEPDPALDCDGDGTLNGPLDGPLCVTGRCQGDASDRLLPRDTAGGWSWDASTSSLRFSGSCVPAPGSNLTVRYGLRPATDTTTCARL
jgi:hypothetical protein